jgi:DNA-binding NtrC family response regulator
VSTTLPQLLIVDDEPAQVAALTRTLGKEGYAPTGVHCAADALSALRAGRFDILITDLLIPGMDGLRLLEAARAIDADLVSIVMTGHGTIHTAIEAMKRGALDYILKPFNLSTILPVLSRAVAVRRLRAENAALLDRVAERSAELEAANRGLRDANRELAALASRVSQRFCVPLQQLAGQATDLVDVAGSALAARERRLLEGIAGQARDLARDAAELRRALEAPKQH